MNRRRVAVIGAGWAGLAAAVRACASGAEVTVFEMAAQPGGRARSLGPAGQRLDNGQHILIGAYRDTLALMRQVGVDPDRLLLRTPLSVVYPDGSGLRLPAGPPALAFVRGVLAWRQHAWRERLGLLAWAWRWRRQGFRCAADWTVADLCATAPPGLTRDFLEPLCVAALNTPAHQASAQVLLTVLRDALFTGPGSADLLLPRVPLSDLLPDPAWVWLAAQGARLHLGHRVQAIAPDGSGWQVDGQPHDHVVLAAPAAESARLVAPWHPNWAALATGPVFQAIVTIWLKAPGARWPAPMLALQSGPDAPAQFGFDLGALQGLADTFALVVSGASHWVEQGLPACAQAVQAQLTQAFSGRPGWPEASQVSLLSVRAEKRATFACTPGLQRPPAKVLPGLAAAGDHVAGPYPATLEGAVRSGLAALDSF